MATGIQRLGWKQLRMPSASRLISLVTFDKPWLECESLNKSVRRLAFLNPQTQRWCLPDVNMSPRLLIAGHGFRAVGQNRKSQSLFFILHPRWQVWSWWRQIQPLICLCICLKTRSSLCQKQSFCILRGRRPAFHTDALTSNKLLHLCSDWGPKKQTNHQISGEALGQNTQSNIYFLLKAVCSVTPNTNLQWWRLKGLQSGYVQYIESGKISGVCSAVKQLAKRSPVGWKQHSKGKNNNNASIQKKTSLRPNVSHITRSSANLETNSVQYSQTKSDKSNPNTAHYTVT